MTKYILRRILIFIPALFVITLLAFIISVNAPGDPVERMMSSSQTGEQSSHSVNTMEQQLYWRKKTGLDLPLFYLSIHSLSTPDTLYKFYSKEERETLRRLIDRYGNWNEISLYYQSLKKLDKRLYETASINDSLLNDDVIRQIRFDVRSLLFAYDENIIQLKLASIERLNNISNYSDYTNEIKKRFDEVKTHTAVWRNYIPVVSFYKSNQYHRWLFGDEYSKGILRGDFGVSYITKQPVLQVIKEKVGWSLFFVLLSVVIAYMVSIPIGVKAATNKDSRFDKISALILFMLYSLPVFWTATVLLMTFANPDVISIFPASGVKPPGGYPEGTSFFEKIRFTLPHLVLPAICYTYSSFAFLSRTMRTSMLEVIRRDYICTARAKGLPESKVIYKHALRNALFPVITVFANIFPLAISGSVIIETVFTIPGMGFETVAAIQNQNYPVIIAIFTITGILALVGYLVSDILYAVADPRVSFTFRTNKA